LLSAGIRGLALVARVALGFAPRSSTWPLIFYDLGYTIFLDPLLDQTFIKVVWRKRCVFDSLNDVIYPYSNL